MFIVMHSLPDGSFWGGQALGLESPLVTYKSLIKAQSGRVPRVDAQHNPDCRARSHKFFLRSFSRNYMAKAGTESQQRWMMMMGRARWKTRLSTDSGDWWRLYIKVSEAHIVAPCPLYISWNGSDDLKRNLSRVVISVQCCRSRINELWNLDLYMLSIFH